MCGAITYEWYKTVFMGTEADATQFPAFCARAADCVGAMTRWVDVSTLPAHIQSLYKKAICAQVDYFAVNGLDSVAGGNTRGFTVGKVSVTAMSGSEIKGMGLMHEHISPLALMYLEQTGLMNPSVPVAFAEPRW